MKKIITLTVAILLTANAYAANVNTDDAATLVQLKGIGKVKAERIVEERANGKYVDCADLAKRVKGIGERTCEKNAKELEY